MILRLMRHEGLYGSEVLPGSFNGSCLGFLDSRKSIAVTKWHISGEAERDFIMYLLTVYFLKYVLSFLKTFFKLIVNAIFNKYKIIS